MPTYGSRLSAIPVSCLGPSHPCADPPDRRLCALAPPGELGSLGGPWDEVDLAWDEEDLADDEPDRAFPPRIAVRLSSEELAPAACIAGLSFKNAVWPADRT